MMLLSRASKSGGWRRSPLRKSYAEISRFLQTRHHGITPSYPHRHTQCLSTTSDPPKLEVSAALRDILDNYKTTIRSQFGDLQDVNPRLSNLCQTGEEVSLFGYLGTRRDVSKKLSFALLRSRNQRFCVQLVSGTGNGSTEILNDHALLKSMKEWTPVCIKGIVRERLRPAPESVVGGMTLINDAEILVHRVEALNSIPDDFIIKQETVFPPEQRHLQLRTDHEFRQNLEFRHRASCTIRKALDDMEFTETETPLLFKSTPEGAREFLVPTRSKGLAYALPQSPQQYKQILMASGIAKYYQFARCFRDEDLRADRQPEFTQLDMEMSFSAENDVMHVIETLLKQLWLEMGKGEFLDGRMFPKMTYHQAMAVYGSDKPDMRLGMEISQISDLLPDDLISKITPLEDPIIDAFKMDLGQSPKEVRKFVADFLEGPEGKPFLENPNGAPGIFISDVTKPLQGLSALGHDFVQNCPEQLTLEDGELLILQARSNVAFSGGSTIAGNLRLALHKAAVAQGIIEQPKGYEFVWIHDFPLFSPVNDTDPGQGGAAGLASTHHPFTAPKTADDVDLLFTAPEKVTAAHYDIVVNGVELGGGSRRIHNAEVQEFILRDVLKMSRDRLEDFRHLLDVLRSGCPPHAGIALGWDRLIAVLLGKDSVRDVIAFPKSGRGEDMLVKSPNAMTKEQLETYHLQMTE